MRACIFAIPMGTFSNLLRRAVGPFTDLKHGYAMTDHFRMDDEKPFQHQILTMARQMATIMTAVDTD